MEKYLVNKSAFFSANDEIIAESEEILLINSEESKEIMLLDPKTLGILETYTVKLANSSFFSFFSLIFP